MARLSRATRDKKTARKSFKDVSMTTGEVEPHRRSISELQADLRSGRTSSQDLVRHFLSRIESIDRASTANPTPLNSILAVNPEASAAAKICDDERRAGGMRGAL